MSPAFGLIALAAAGAPPTALYLHAEVAEERGRAAPPLLRPLAARLTFMLEPLHKIPGSVQVRVQRQSLVLQKLALMAGYQVREQVVRRLPELVISSTAAAMRRRTVAVVVPPVRMAMAIRLRPTLADRVMLVLAVQAVAPVEMVAVARSTKPALLTGRVVEVPSALAPVVVLEEITGVAREDYDSIR